MDQIEPTAQQAELLKRAKDAGVVLDFAILDVGQSAGAPDIIHRYAAESFLVTISNKYEVDPEIRAPGLRGHAIPVDEFYGWHFDRIARRLRVRADGKYSQAWRDLYTDDLGVKGSLSHEFGYGPYRWADDDDPNNAIWVRDAISSGYTHAFCDPPYRIRLQPRELELLFNDIDDAILQRPSDETEIWSWPGGDWADYFIPGLDWWGASLYTVRASPSTIVAIGASSTD